MGKNNGILSVYYIHINRWPVYLTSFTFPGCMFSPSRTQNYIKACKWSAKCSIIVTLEHVFLRRFPQDVSTYAHRFGERLRYNDDLY